MTETTEHLQPKLSVGEVGRIEWERRLLVSDLPSIARLVALVICRFTDVTGAQGVWLAIPEIAHYCHLTVPVTRRYLTLLEEAGWLHTEPREPGNRGTPIRFLTFPGPRS